MPYATNPNDDVRIYYEVEGSGPPLVLLHGYSGNHLYWRINGYVDALKDTFTLIIIDGRGHGFSDKPHEPEAYSMQRRVGDIICVIEDLGHAHVHVCGYSNGAEDGYCLASIAPERLRSLIAISGRTTGIPTEKAGTYLEASRRLRAMTKEAFAGARPEPYFQATLLNDPAALAAIQLAKSRGIFIGDVSASLNGLTVPCLVLAGTDEADYAIIRDSAAGIPSAIFVSFDDLDHIPMFVRSDLTLPHITAFLDCVETSATGEC